MVQARDGNARVRHAGALTLACAGAVALYALLMIFLTVVIYGEDHSLNWAPAILGVSGLVVAGLVVGGWRWPAWLALAYSVVTTIADAPHQIAELAHRSSHAPASAFILIVGALAIVVSLAAAVRSLRPRAGLG